jgi:hypothetical protein
MNMKSVLVLLISILPTTIVMAAPIYSRDASPAASDIFFETSELVSLSARLSARLSIDEWPVSGESVGDVVDGEPTDNIIDL